MNENMLSRALETNSYTLASGSGASYINPSVWVRKIVDFAKAKLVMEPLGWVDKTLVGQAGTTLNLQFNVAISAAAVAESTSITPSALSYTQVQFTPSEYAVAIALTRKERIRSIQDIMEEKTRDMGYALAKLKDSNVFTALASTTITSITPNSVAVSAIASSDTMNTDIIADAIAAIRAADEEPKYLVIHPYQEKHLMKLSDFIDSSV
jgi:N4-gp56 family major capsid protein